jgi:hypothetical protein
MLRRSLLAALILSSAFSIGAAQTEWVKVAPIGGGFSIMLPAKPTEESKVDKDYSSHSLSLTTDTTIYIVEYGDYAPTIKLDPAGELAANRDNFVKTFEGKLLDSREISLQGHSGLEFSAENANLSAKCRVYIFGNRVYMLASGVKKGDTNFQNVDRFLTSFAFSQP